MMPRAPASSAKQIRWAWFAATRTSGAACLPRIVSIDGRSCLISQAECWVSNSRKSYPALARIDTSMSGVTVVPTTVLPDLMASLRVFIWRRCLPRVALAPVLQPTDVRGALARHYHVAPVSRRVQQHGLGKIAVRVEHREGLAGSEVPIGLSSNVAPRWTLEPRTENRA